MASLLTPDIIKQRNNAKKNLYTMFHKKVEMEIVDMVLSNCDYDENTAYEHLLVMAGDMLDTETDRLKSRAASSHQSDEVEDITPKNIIQHQPTNLFEQLSTTSQNRTSNDLMRTSTLLANDSSVVLAIPSNDKHFSLFGNLSQPNRSTLFPEKDALHSSKQVNLLNGMTNSFVCESVVRDCATAPPHKATLPQSFQKTQTVDIREDTSTETTKDQLKQRINNPLNFILVVMRGLPGSGKSFMAKALGGIRAIRCSADDYFIKDGKYRFDSTLLSEAHRWNQERANMALKYKLSPVFIDNTNTQAWEMKPYVAMALQHKYEIIILEPDTPWAWQPSVLARKNSHWVPKEAIENMLARYERNITVTGLIRMINPNYVPPVENVPGRGVRKRSPLNSPVNQRRHLKSPQNSPTSHRRKSPEHSPMTHRRNITKTASKTSYELDVEEELAIQGSSNNQKQFEDRPNKSIKDFEITKVVDGIENVFVTSSPTSKTQAIQRENKPIHTADLDEEENNEIQLPSSSKNTQKSTHKETNNLKKGRGRDLFSEPPPLTRIVLDNDFKMQSSANKQNSQGRIGQIVNSYKTWSDEHPPNQVKKGTDVDFVTSIDVDMHDSKKKRVKDQMPELVNNEQLNFSLQFLCECFPDFSAAFLKDWLKRYNGDLLRTSDYLSRLSQVEELPDEDDIVTINDDDDIEIEAAGVLRDIDVQSGTELQPRGGMFLCDVDNEDAKLKIAIDQKLGEQLIKKYGKETDLNEMLSDDDYVFVMDEDIGKKMYSNWLEAIKTKKRNADCMLADDEEYAKRLQDEENLSIESTDGRGKSKKKKTKPLSIDTQFLTAGSTIFSPSSPWKTLEPVKASTSQPKGGSNLTPKQMKIRNELYNKFPGVDEDDLDQVLEASSYNLEAATKLVSDSCGLTNQSVKNVHAEGGGDNWQLVASPPRKKIHASNSTPHLQQAESPVIVISPDSNHSLYQDMNEETQDYGDFRAEAILHRNLRTECYQKAAKAFQEKKGDVAQYYADKARQHTNKMKEAHARAADLTLQRRNKQYMRKQQIIDLHGLHADEAVRAAKNFLENAYQVDHRIVYIITGRGNHSKTGVSAVRSAVLRCIEVRKLRYELQKNGGMIKVYLRSSVK